MIVPIGLADPSRRAGSVSKIESRSCCWASSWTFAASWTAGSGRGGGAGCTDGAIATALAVTVATPAMRFERVEIFTATLLMWPPTWMNLRRR